MIALWIMYLDIDPWFLVRSACFAVVAYTIVLFMEEAAEREKERRSDSSITLSDMDPIDEEAMRAILLRYLKRYQDTMP